MGLREPDARRSRRVVATLLAVAALALPPALQAVPAAAEALGAAAPGSGEPSPPPREVVFVVDLSSAMSGAPLERAKEALATALERLRPVDTFNVLALGERTQALFPASWPVGDQSVGRAARWIAGLESDGSAEVLRGLAAALGPPDEGYATPGTRAVREVIVYAPGAIGATFSGAGEASAGVPPAVQPATASAGAAPPRAGTSGAGSNPARPDGSGRAASPHPRAGGASAGTAGAEPQGGAVSLLLRLGVGAVLFAAALAYALRRGLVAPEAAR